MSEKRKDTKGRILRTGEQQRRNGQYMFTYTDSNGKKAYVYSWKLEPTDKIPAGKRDCESLREKEKQIQRDLADGIAYRGDNMTVLDLIEKYIRTKSNIRTKTKANYNYIINIIRNDMFGAKRIDTVKISDAKEWIKKLKETDNRKYNCIRAIRSVVKPAFKMAVDDDLIRKNPFDFTLNSVISNDSAGRESLTCEERDSFLEFIRNDGTYSQYYDEVYILFHTGMRISEFCGLTIADIDTENKRVSIERQLQKSGKKYRLEETKTGAGKRVLIVSDDVNESFERLIQNRKKPEIETVVDGISGFLCLDKNGMPTTAMHWDDRFERITRKYESSIEKLNKKVTPHICRHTYATLAARAGMTSKTLQYLMGHSDIRTTLNVYTHTDMEGVTEEVERLNKGN